MYSRFTLFSNTVARYVFSRTPLLKHRLFIPMARAHRGGIRGCFQASVIPVDDIADAEAVTGVEGVLALARAGGEMGKRFEDVCRTNRCMESWDFVVDVLRYEMERACPSMFRCLASPTCAYAYAYDDPPTKNVYLVVVLCVSINFVARWGSNDPDE